MLRHFIDHREDVIIRRTRFDLRKAEERAHILEGLLKALDNLDEVIAIIRASRDAARGQERLMASFAFSELRPRRSSRCGCSA